MPSVLDGLRGVEYEVGKMMLEGMTFEEIADQLGHVRKTSRNIASRMYHEYGYRDRADFMAREIRYLRESNAASH